MKLDITPAEWGISFPDKLPYYRIVGGIFTDNQIMVCSEIIEYHNAKAIVTAVNNTYHAGINPEAVPEMLEVAKEVREWYEKNHAKYMGEDTPVCFSKLLSAIQKATL